MSVGVDDYDFRQKNAWRKCEWREVRRRVPRRWKAKILYLAGEQDLDRPFAVKNGFNPDNMIAVEKGDTKESKRILKILRKRGTTTIGADFNDALLAWPDNEPVGVIIADFCGGFSPKISEVYDAVTEKPCFRDSVVSLTLFRGRERGWDTPSSLLQEQLGYGVPRMFMKQADVGMVPLSELHRGFLFLLYNCIEVANIVLRGEEAVYPKQIVGVTTGDIMLGPIEPPLDNMLWALFHAHRPQFLTYKGRSGIAHLDTVIFSSPLRGTGIKGGWWHAPMGTKIDKAKKQVTAARAIRTHRLKKSAQ